MAIAETALDVSGTQSKLEQYAIYFDDLARIEGSWKFTHRLFVPIYVGRDCATGDLLTQRSALLQPE